MNVLRKIPVLRVSVRKVLFALLLGTGLSSIPLQIVYADPPATSPNAASPSPSTQFVVDPMPIGFTYGPKGGILIHVLLNGNTPATFLLDSGFGPSCITQDMVKKLGLTPQPALGPDGKPLDTIVKNALGVFPAMQLGSISYASIGLVVVTEKQLHLNGLVGQPIDGVIGNNILGFIPCFLDFAKKQVTFLCHLPVTDDLLERLGMQDASVCPLTTIMDGSIYVTPVHMVNETHTDDENLAIDLGAYTSVLTEQSANQLGLAETSQSPGHTIYGDLALSSGVLTTLSFPTAGIILKNQNVAYTKKHLPDGINPCIGSDLLSQFQVLLDFSEKKMYLKPNPPSARTAANSATPNSP